jgi:hypothetical protein
MSHFARIAAFGATIASVILDEDAGIAFLRQQFALQPAPLRTRFPWSATLGYLTK